MTDRRAVYCEVGALCGHPNPDAFADLMLAGPCAHHGNHWRDDEPCPEPCGQTHMRCCSCFAPLDSCQIIIDLEARNA